MLPQSSFENGHYYQYCCDHPPLFNGSCQSFLNLMYPHTCFSFNLRNHWICFKYPNYFYCKFYCSGYQVYMLSAVFCIETILNRHQLYLTSGFPGGSEVKVSACSVGDLGSIPGSGRKIPWRRNWQPTPVFLPGESHGRRSLVGYSPRGRKESDVTERFHSLLDVWFTVHVEGMLITF